MLMEPMIFMEAGSRKHTKTALEALRKQSNQVSFCIAANCTNDCLEFTNGPVCEHYAAKTDEIRRIHEEGDEV